MALRKILLRAINIVLVVVVGLIGLDVLFQLLSANPANEVVAFVDRTAGRLLVPFQGMFERQNFLLTALIAVIAYSLVAAIASAIVRMIPARRRREPLPE